MDANHTNKNGDNCLLMSCYKNAKLNTLKYLLDNVKMNINSINKQNNNCLMIICCKKNADLVIVKYLIDNQKININHIDKDRHNCLDLAYINGINFNVIEYLVGEKDM